MGSVRVLAEYVTLKVEDPTAGVHFVGYLKDSIVQNVEAESLKHHLSLGMVEKFEAPKDEPAAPVDPPARPAVEAPAGNAGRDAWADYARSKGASEDELKEPADGGLSRDALRDKYGK